MRSDKDFIEPIEIGDRVLVQGCDEPKFITGIEHIDGEYRFEIDGSWLGIRKDGSTYHYSLQHICYCPDLETIESRVRPIRETVRQLSESALLTRGQHTIIPPMSRKNFLEATRLKEERLLKIRNTKGLTK